MTRIAELWQLQEIDSALDARRASLDDARERIGESDEIAELQQAVESKRGAHRAAEAEQRDIELHADEVRGKISEAEQRLYSGNVRNPKELQGLQEDVAQLKRQLSSLEDRGIAALTALETAEQELRAAEHELATRETAWRDEQSELQTRVERLAAEIADYEQRRKEAVGQVDPDALGTYNHVRRTHHGRGVAKLDRNLCLGCRISLPVSIVNRARAGSTVVQCPNCERILYAA
jgi:predicted  nucleic acid-binding Zn-ribbon protein